MRKELEERIRRKTARRLKAQREGSNPLWVGLGSFGIIGWSIAVPALVGVAIGSWLDRSTDSAISWTLLLLLAGVIVGCVNAWFWISRMIHGRSPRNAAGVGDPHDPKPTVPPEDHHA